MRRYHYPATLADACAHAGPRTVSMRQFTLDCRAGATVLRFATVHRSTRPHARIAAAVPWSTR
jgi:hypothetical protein